jgi:hypothetical protein
LDIPFCEAEIYEFGTKQKWDVEIWRMKKIEGIS